jgi:hypothetical protein
VGGGGRGLGQYSFLIMGFCFPRSKCLPKVDPPTDMTDTGSSAEQEMKCDIALSSIGPVQISTRDEEFMVGRNGNNIMILPLKHFCTLFIAILMYLGHGSCF